MNVFADADTDGVSLKRDSFEMLFYLHWVTEAEAVLCSLQFSQQLPDLPNTGSEVNFI